MTRSAKAWWHDMTHTSAVEQRVKDYKTLYRQVSSQLETISMEISYLDELDERYRLMVEKESIESAGVVIDELNLKAEAAYTEFQTVYDYIKQKEEELYNKLIQIQAHLEYYKVRERYENTLEKDLKAEEFNYM